MRKNIRLEGYDYASDGYYFVTICTDYRKPLLAQKPIRDIVIAELARINDLRGVTLDYHVVMPTHVHLIVVLEDSRYLLGEIVRRFKSKTSVERVKTGPGNHRERLWQPNYYEHIIRNERSLSRVRTYIENNPLAERLDWKKLEL